MVEAWQYERIPVRAEQGQFSSEFAVSLRLAEGRDVSLFVDRDLVTRNGDQAFLKVVVVDRNVDNNTLSILLPSETFETASRWAVVPAVH